MKKKIKASEAARSMQKTRSMAIAVHELGMKTKDPKVLKAAAALRKQGRRLGTEAPQEMGTEAAETLGTGAPRKLGV